MKKLLSLLLILVMTLGLTISVAAAKKAPVITEVEKTGVLKNFNEKSILVNEDGKSLGYSYDQTTKVYQLGNIVNLMDVAKKGLKLNYKVKHVDGKATNLLTYIDVAAPGLEGEGFLTLPISSIASDLMKLTSGAYVGLNVCLNNVRATITDSALASPTDLKAEKAIKVDAAGNINMSIADVKELNPEEDTAYQYDNAENINLGDINIVKDSLVVTVNRQKLKVIDGAAAFDTKDPADEVKLVLTKTFYSLEFEAAIAEKEPATQEELDKILSISYTKNMYKIITSEMTAYRVNDDVYCELNGKETTLAKALNRGNYAFILTNTDGELIYINAFYRDLECEVVSKGGNNITVKVSKPGLTPYNDTLVMSSDVLFVNAQDEEISSSSINSGDKVVLTTDPEQGYMVVKIVK
jgi:hypothetical protein